MKSFIIAAMGSNRVIGDGPNLPWSNMRADEEHFLKTIKDCILLTGRKSMDSELALRLFKDKIDQTIVLTNQERLGEFKIAHNLASAFELAETLPGRALAILGGATVYEKTLDFVEELIITEIHSQFQGDVFFPEIDKRKWQEVERQKFSADPHNSYDYSFVKYHKRVFAE